MRVTDFSFTFPRSLIANYPMSHRSGCRLLTLNGTNGSLRHGVFTDIIDNLNSGDLLVFNNTRVIPARVYGRKASGGKIEILVERILDDKRILAHIRTSKILKPGTEILFGEDENIYAIVVSQHKTLFEIIFYSAQNIQCILNTIGHIPIPPYINRPDKKIDCELYQTIFSQKPGAVAAPTAGLHFDHSLIIALREKGVELAFVTLHVGAGTFQPLHVDSIEDHIMHPEYTEVSQEVVDAVLSCKERGNRVVAVGTTSVRSLESAAQAVQDALIAPFFDDTRIFIYPGYHYQIIDALITNFHLPKSTLIMLVAAFAGYRYTMNAYREAITQQYRFFSYGDAMFITHNLHAPEEIIGV